MAFFDELGKVISDKSKEAAGKVKDLTGVIQLRTKLSAEKEKVNKSYINLGKAYYDKHEASAEEDYAADFDLIRMGLMKMAELEDEISELEGTRVCAECGAKVEKDAQFCSKCGASMEEKTAAPMSDYKDNEEEDED
ncbi:MAG: zinc ribbon domain-containing protein [Clostridium sp.]